MCLSQHSRNFVAALAAATALLLPLGLSRTARANEKSSSETTTVIIVVEKIGHRRARQPGSHNSALYSARHARKIREVKTPCVQCENRRSGPMQVTGDQRGPHHDNDYRLGPSKLRERFSFGKR